MSDETRRSKIVELPDGTRVTQPPLFVPPRPGRGRRGPLTPPPVAPFPGRLTPDGSLGLALEWFREEMERKGYAPNTQANYAKAVARLVRFLGRSRRLKEISPEDLRRFDAWLRRQDRAEKTKELTITGIRAFFAALVDAGILPVNPAADLYPAKASSPLPVVLFDAEADKLRQTAAEMANPDPLPALLLVLLLDLGLRLGEVERLEVADLDLSNPLRPVVHVRYRERRHRAKQRSLMAPPALTPLLEKYLERHPTGEGRLFLCSRRHLQNVIERLGEAAGLPKRVTPSMLRWTCALNQFRAGVPEERLRARLGLSKLGWEDVKKRLKALARKPV